MYPTVSAFVDGGINGTIFAYGQTGAGKTYSIVGDTDSTSTATPGILPRTLELIYTRLDEGVTIELSFYEIYNDKVFNLIPGKKAAGPLDIREDKD